MSLRDRLIRILEEGSSDPAFAPDDEMSLIRSGRIDSLGLYRLALWIEEEIRTGLDMTSLDPMNEWDTIPDILAFIRKRRG